MSYISKYTGQQIDNKLDEIESISEQIKTNSFYFEGQLAKKANNTDVVNLLNVKLNISDLLNSVYPVGSIYQSTSSVSPASLLGGTWEKIEGRFLFASNSNYPVGDVGGETRHTLTNGELPKLTGYITMHSAATATNVQSVGGVFSTSINNSSSYKDGGTTQGGSYSVGNVNFSIGNNESHNNMPPYLVVNVWKRVA